MNHKMKPELFFNFKDSNGFRHPLKFSNPIDVICTWNLEDVLSSFEKVQKAVDAGYYAAGYVTYEAAPAFDSEFRVNSEGNMPLVWFGIFEEPVQEELQEENSFQIDEWTASEASEEYQSNIEQIKQYIEQGDTYQVNYTVRLSSSFSGDAKSYYNQLAKAQSADYSAFIQTDDHTILSASPELFFHKSSEKITTRPMKGTVKRGKTYEEDCEKAAWLAQSEKDKAENVMIVDLLRNDLGTIAQPGSVEVPELFTIEKYPTVYQMTSTVTAAVNENTSLTDLFHALFPCGSITGAPKISTMRIIQELESAARGVYCGTIGYITPNNEAIFNVPIRTVAIDHHDGTATYGVGGGVTWDSTSDGEYDEILTKAALLKRKQPSFLLLESLALIDGDYFILENHLKRIEKSARYFDFSFDQHAVRHALKKIASVHHLGKWKIRLLIDKKGKIDCEAISIKENPLGTVNIDIANTPVNSEDVFLYHKTTNRSVYEDAKAFFPDSYDVLLWNEKSEVTEFTGGNIVVKMEGHLFTPPVSCGLLAGTFREELLLTETVAERVIYLHELKNCEQIWFINSVRQWIKVSIE
ncbi:aminodeoxychorismate synthase component I [Virgibacillus flavescens]|uniref:aminodeoxychorismate synthase component I n=1 Tax=Virgibacillus flavescens TaxID=1611422 RepID=UPI003D346E05